MRNNSYEKTSAIASAFAVIVAISAMLHTNRLDKNNACDAAVFETRDRMSESASSDLKERAIIDALGDLVSIYDAGATNRLKHQYAFFKEERCPNGGIEICEEFDELMAQGIEE